MLRKWQTDSISSLAQEYLGIQLKKEFQNTAALIILLYLLFIQVVQLRFNVSFTRETCVSQHY